MTASLVSLVLLGCLQRAVAKLDSFALVTLAPFAGNVVAAVAEIDPLV